MKNLFSDLPKVELHLHLDCSISYKVAKELKPGLSLQEFNDRFVIRGKCNGLAEFLERTTPAVALMQTTTNLEMITLDLYRQLSEDNVIYAEIRFSPLLHLEGGLTPHEVCNAVKRGVAAGKEEYGIAGGLIICTLRHYNEQQSLQCAALAAEFAGPDFLGFDIASDEAGFPIDAHVAAFQYAHAHKVPCTAHGGEARGADSLWEILENFHPQRIGHGVRCIEDIRLMHFMRDNKIHLEICPSSNIQLDIFSLISDHPLNKLYEEDLSLSINTDGRTIFDLTLEEEYRRIAAAFDWTTHHFLHCNLEAIQHAFCEDTVKRLVTEKLIAAYGEGVS